MSSTTHKLPFVRFTRQVATDPMALLSTNVAAATAAQLLQAAPWVEQSEDSPTFPARAAMLTNGTPSAAFDAYKYCGDYADGNQIAHAGAVAYRFAVPADALTGPTDITSIALPIYVDRWLVDGIRVAAYLSDSPAPPADWTTIREGDIYDDAVLPMTYTDPDGVRIVIEKNGTTTLTWAASTASKQYIYVMLTLEDYTTTRGFWIEGSTLIQGAEAVTTFATSVDADEPDDVSFDALCTMSSVYAPIHDVVGENTVTVGVPSGTQNNNVNVTSSVTTQPTFTRDVNTLLMGHLLIQPGLTNAIETGTGNLIEASIALVVAGSVHTYSVRSAVKYLGGAVLSGGIARQLVFVEGVSSYNNAVRVRLNIYAVPTASDGTTSSVSDVRGYLLANYAQWMTGTYSGNNLVNFASVELNPEGYNAGHVVAASGGNMATGLYAFFVSVQISKIVGDLKLAHGGKVGLSYNPTVLQLLA
jgi:hypothetical protein